MNDITVTSNNHEYSPALRVLLTRSNAKNTSLIKALKPHNIAAFSHPMLELHGALTPEAIASTPIFSCDLLIAVSEPAVEFLCSTLNECIDTEFVEKVVSHLSAIPIVAIGEATAKSMQDWLSREVEYPMVATSEGLLNEPIASNALHEPCIVNKQVVILRGNGGREHIATELAARGANVRYIESYTRQPCVDVNNIWLDQWKSQQINCIVATSVEQFNAIWRLALTLSQQNWLQNCTWVVASERIKHALLVRCINSVNIHNAEGASNSAILNQLLIVATRFEQNP